MSSLSPWSRSSHGAHTDAGADAALGDLGRDQFGTDEFGVDWMAALARLDECDGYALLVVDPQTGATDIHGPYEGLRAVVAADELRRSLDSEGLDDVEVRVARMHLPEAA